MELDFSAFTEPPVLILWIVVGCIAGIIGNKIMFRRRRGGGTFGNLLQTCILGMAGSFVGIMAGLFLGIPGADEVGLMMGILAVAGTLLVIFLVTFFQG